MIHCHSSPPPPPHPSHLQNDNSCKQSLRTWTLPKVAAIARRWLQKHRNSKLPKFRTKPQLNNQVLRSLSIGQAIDHKTLCSRNSATQQNLPQKTGQDARGLLGTDSSGLRSIVAFEV
jgi:hypothetical protein